MKIINIIHFPVDYDSWEDKPNVKWETENGNWCGIWEGHQTHRLANILLVEGYKMDYEIWRPDLRADRIYIHEFRNGLVYKLYPAEVVTRRSGLKKFKEVVSWSLINELKNQVTREFIILHVHNFSNYFVYKILSNINVPVLIELHSRQAIPKREKKRIRKNIFVNYYYYKIDKVLKGKRYSIVYRNSKDIDWMNKYDAVDIEQIYTGIDSNYWKKLNNIGSLRKKYRIPKHTKVLVMACRFVPLKQIDKVIEVLEKIDIEKDYDFVLMLAGNGEKKYKNYLESKAGPLNRKGKLYFTGFLNEQELRQLLNEADLLISASTSEGASVSVMQAVACELPVFCTRVNGVDDILAKFNAGVLLEPFNYGQWRNFFIDFFKGHPVPILDREIVREWFDWSNIIRKYINMYNRLGEFY